MAYVAFAKRRLVVAEFVFVLPSEPERFSRCRLNIYTSAMKEESFRDIALREFRSRYPGSKCVFIDFSSPYGSVFLTVWPREGKRWRSFFSGSAGNLDSFLGSEK